jgi:group I intron endonuclease
MFTNKVTNDFYIGQSKNLYNRFLNYFNPAYLRRLSNSIIGRAILKYGYSNFSLTILEYCDKANLTEREQYYMDKLNPVYPSFTTQQLQVKLNPFLITGFTDAEGSFITSIQRSTKHRTG